MAMEREPPPLQSTEEAAAVSRIVAELHETGDSGAVRALVALDWARAPVDVVTFVESPDYLALENQVWPRLLDDLVRFFHEGEYLEAILKGAIGWGKSSWAELAMLYMVYTCSCLRDPQGYYGLMRGSTIAFVNISVNKLQAKRVIFKGIKAKVQNSPYFREAFPYDQWVESELRFPRDIWVAPMASTEGDVLGLNVFGGCMDESNFMPVVERSKMSRTGDVYDHAVILYNAIARRLQSRFNRLGRVPGKIIVVSSSQYPDDFTERKAKEALDNPQILVLDYAQWQTKPRHLFLPQRFYVEVGDHTHGSRILAEGEVPRPGATVIDVPEDFREAFKKDPDGAVRDIAGKTVHAIEPFLRRREMIGAAVDPGRRHPFPRHELVSGEGFPLDVAALCVETERGWRPRWHPQCARSAHVDLALTRDKCGVAVGCSPGQKRVVRVDPVTGQVYEERAPLLWYDLLVEIVAPPAGEISIAEVRDLLELLRRYGFRLRLVTYDSFQSAESIQQWKRKGIPAAILSVDSDLEAYEALKSGLYEERVSYYESPPLQRQLVELEINHAKRKVDHRPRGGKDLGDGAAGVAHHWTSGLIREALPASPGILVGPTPSLPVDEENFEWLTRD